MGVDIGGILERKSIEFEDLRNKRIAIDAFNTLYQFLSIIRQRDGTPLVDTKGRTTSHLAGIFYRNARLLECGVKPIYVFDGKSPEFKEKTKEKRSEAKQEARKKLERAKELGVKDLRIFAQATATLDEEKIESSKKLLSYMGIPVIQAPSEGEAQAAYMAKEGFAYATGSQDYDALIFGSPILVRNLTISGKRKLPRRGVYISITPELIDLKKTLENL